jgi:hypothetical protein
MGVQRSGQLVVLEESGAANVHDVIYTPEVRRLSTMGTVDPSFSSGIDGSGVPVTELLVESDDKLSVVGGFGSKAVIQRLDSNGQRDNAFGRPSWLVSGAPPGSANLFYNAAFEELSPPVGAAQDALGRYYLVGTGLARLDAAGRPDRTFGDCGKALFGSQLAFGGPLAVARQPSGRIIVVGVVGNNRSGAKSANSPGLVSANDVKATNPHGRPTLPGLNFGLFTAPRAQLLRGRLRRRLQVLSPQYATVTATLITRRRKRTLPRTLARAQGDVSPCKPLRLALGTTSLARRMLARQRLKHSVELTLRLTLRNRAGRSAYSVGGTLTFKG